MKSVAFLLHYSTDTRMAIVVQSLSLFLVSAFLRLNKCLGVYVNLKSRERLLSFAFFANGEAIKGQSIPSVAPCEFGFLL